MTGHVLAIYRATRAGERAVRHAQAIADEQGAQLTIGVTTGDRETRCCCAISTGRWRAIERAEVLADLERARSAVGGHRSLQLAVIEGNGPRVIAAAAERMRCDVVVVPVSRLAIRGGLARAVRAVTDASVVGIRR